MRIIFRSVNVLHNITGMLIELQEFSSNVHNLIWKIMKSRNTFLVNFNAMLYTYLEHLPKGYLISTKCCHCCYLKDCQHLTSDYIALPSTFKRFVFVIKCEQTFATCAGTILLKLGVLDDVRLRDSGKIV